MEKEDDLVETTSSFPAALSSSTTTTTSTASLSATKKTGRDVDWSRYGLSETSNYQTSSKTEFLYTTEPNKEVKELFEHEQEQASDSTDQEPWWKSNFFVTRKLLFGTWDGVFTTCVMNMVGVVIFLRSGWMVGYAGIGLSLLIVLISFIVALATVMSAVGICDRCHIGKGGVYFIITHVLGRKIGGATGLLYCMGHAAACALYCTGFAESLVGLLHWNNSWAIRCVSIITLFVMLGIAISGVKWIVRFQLVLIFILMAAMMDFIIGTLAQEKPGAGFTGFSNYNFEENLKSDFKDGTSFFLLFGVFFPTACGVLAGVNMSGDLKNPSENIPEGSVAGLGLCGAVYTLIVLFLGSTCTRAALQTDYMIMEKISMIGALFIFGLFVASLSSSLGGLVGPPRVLQCIAEDDVLPILKPFAKLTGPNQEPQNATLIVSLIALLFIFIGNLNALATIVTMPFLVTYTTINYAYFALAMSFDIKTAANRKTQDSNGNNYSAVMVDKNENSEETIENTFREDSSLFVKKETNDVSEGDVSVIQDGGKVHTGLLNRQDSSCQQIEWIQKKHSNELYAKVCNRWISLFSAFVCLILSFCISWIYALANITVTLLLYVFISQARPGLSPGVANDFNFGHWICSPFSKGNGKNLSDEHIIVQSNHMSYGISMYQVTEDNTDYEHRDKMHHASLIKKPVPYN